MASYTASDVTSSADSRSSVYGLMDPASFNFSKVNVVVGYKIF